MAWSNRRAAVIFPDPPGYAFGAPGASLPRVRAPEGDGLLLGRVHRARETREGGIVGGRDPAGAWAVRRSRTVADRPGPTVSR